MTDKRMEDTLPKLCFRVCHRSSEDDKASWYQVDLESPDEQGGHLTMESLAKINSDYDSDSDSDSSGYTIIPSPPPSPLHFCSHTAVGSTIYVLGGLLKLGGLAIPNVYAFDATSPEQGWVERPSMAAARTRPLTAVLDGKLYVFGNWGYTHPNPWAEVFVSESDRWYPLCGLDTFSSPASHATIALVWHERKSVVLVNEDRRSLYLYDPQCDACTFLDVIPRTIYFNCNQGAVLVDGTIYYRSVNCLYAYQIVNGSCISTIIAGLPEDEEELKERNCILSPSLFHLGGDVFCMVWVNDDSVHYARFRASISTETSGKVNLTACVESSKSYPVVDQYSKFGGALLWSGVASA